MSSSCGRAVVVVVLAVVAAVVVAEPSYPQPAPCYPKTQYVTKYHTEVQQVSTRHKSSRLLRDTGPAVQ